MKTLLSLLLLFATRACAQDTFDGCKPTGNAKDSKHMNLNVLKNRFLAPDSYDTLDFDAFSNLTENQVHQLRGGVLTGYVIGVKQSGGESCNCGQTDPVHVDTHITIVKDPAHTEGKFRMICEVTPRIRAAMKKQGIDWTWQTLKKKLLHHVVQFSGWQLYDWEHEPQAYNTNPKNKLDWRHGCPEIHSIFSYVIIK